MKIFRLCFVLLFFIFFVACEEKEKKDESRIPYLEVEGRYLYLEDIESVIPNGISKEDSLSVAENYIKKWVTDVLLYTHANKNISDKESIEKLVVDYRKSLVIHQYEENLITERLADVLSEKRMQAFYEQHKERFRLNECVIKGVFIQVPLGAPKFKLLQKWMRKLDQKSLENIEKYSIQNATSYQYFGDKWVRFAEISKNMPLQVDNESNYLRSTNYIETSDSSYHFILRVVEAGFVGDVEPFDIAKEKIYTILMNKERLDFIRKIQEKLYKEAVNNQDITYFPIHNQEDIATQP